MIFNKRTCCQAVLLLTGLCSSTAFSASQSVNSSSFLSNYSHFLSSLSSKLKHGHAVLQLGGYWSIAGSQQHIAIQDLIGDTFIVTQNGGSNGLVGWGYFIDGQEEERFKMSYGINAFYLPKTSVAGNVIQEDLYTNLAYRYQLTHYPMYAVAKSTIKTKYPRYDATLDVGIGPNFMQAQGFNETSLDGITLPDTIFSSHTRTTFTATVGAGIKVNHFFGQVPLECGYRFFYLGQGHFNEATNQVLNTLNTGQVYANAVMCSITV